MNEFNSEEIIKLTKALIGEIYPLGETNMDDESLTNLKVSFDVIDKLLSDITKLITYRNSSYYSVQKIGTEAYDQIKQWNKELSDFIEECEYDDQFY